MLMRHIFNPPAIVAIAPAFKEAQAIQQEHIEFEDKLKRQLFFGSISKRGTDGRTYNYIDKDGEYVSSFLSPYNKNILDNVEPQIKDLISALLSKGYLTAGSCQGHTDGEEKSLTRWVMISFISLEERNKFIKNIDSFKLPVFWYFNFLNTIENPKIEETRDGVTLSINFKDSQYKSIDEARHSRYTNKDLADYWNIMFARKYTEYYPVMMCICSCPGDISFLEKIKTFMLWPFRNYYTTKLTAKIKSINNYEW
jgi:hypothetical protein